MSTYEEVLIEYNKLKEDFEEHKKVAEEYERELEETNREVETMNSELKLANEKMMKEINKFKEDNLQIKEKNIEKMKDIQYLESQLDKYKASFELIKEEKSVIERKIIILENDNNDYINKVRELECWSEELNIKLDAALEENIILHNENEMNKTDMQEMIQRLQEELEEIKNDVTSKDKIIQRIEMHRDFLMKTAYNVQDDLNNNVLSNNRNSLLNLKNSSSNEKINVVTPVNKNTKIPEKFLESYSQSCINNLQDENKNKIEKLEPKDEFVIQDNLNNQNYFTLNKLNPLGIEKDLHKIGSSDSITNFDKSHSRRISLHTLEKYMSKEFNKANSQFNENEKMDNNEDDEDKIFIRETIDLEIKNILDNRRNFILNTLTLENFSFDYSSVVKINNQQSESKNIKSKTNFNIMKNQRLVENIDEMLSKIQARKEKVLMQKKLMQNKLEKIGVKIC